MNRDRFQYVIPATTGDALLNGRFWPEHVARVDDARIPRYDLPLDVDIDVYDLPGPAVVLVVGDDSGDRYFFADDDALDELVDQIADGDADLVELSDGANPVRDRLEDQYYVTNESDTELNHV